MAKYTVGEEGATVFTADGRLIAELKPGTVVVPGTIPETTEPRTAGQEHPTRRGYDDKLIRPEHGP
jgi:hypothetical protein